MSFINPEKLQTIKNKLSSDAKYLKKLYESKRKNFQSLKIDLNQVEEYEKNGWEVFKHLKTKLEVRKLKKFSKKFEDDIWCQFYELGFTTLNIDNEFKLPYGKGKQETKQIDIISIKEDIVFLVECKSSKNSKTAPSYKEGFELIQQRIGKFVDCIRATLNNKDLKFRFLWATRNLKVTEKNKAFKPKTELFKFYNDNTYKYINELIKNYKNAAFYQFMGLFFKGDKLKKQLHNIPALRGKMGNKTYYMFSIEPSTLLQIGFVLHRTKVNEEELPTYQRLLVPSRLKKITAYIDDGGFFPNSIIVNFNQELIFEPSSQKNKDSDSKLGILKIPSNYAIAYIIDGQHRVYGYANSQFLNTNTIPVVAFQDLDTTKQLEMFMDINQNQKAVSPSLRGILEKDLHWNSNRIDSRLKALRASIIEKLCTNSNSFFYNKIQIGEDKGEFTFKAFEDGLRPSLLFPKASQSRYTDNTDKCLYDTNHNDKEQVMKNSQKLVCELLSESFSYANDKFKNSQNRSKELILSTRGITPYIILVGDIRGYLLENKNQQLQTLFDKIEPYLNTLIQKILKTPNKEIEKLLIEKGAGVVNSWLLFFKSLINSTFPEYAKKEITDWEERKNEQLQQDAKKTIDSIESYIKKTVLNILKDLFEDKWELEINAIKRKCMDRLEQQKEKNYKDGIKDDPDQHWTTMFQIIDYKTIIEKYWSKETKSNTSFSKICSIDIGRGFNSKSDKTKWITFFNNYRNDVSHRGTKGKGLNKENVNLLEKIYHTLTVD